MHEKAPTLEKPSEATCKFAEEVRNGIVTNNLQIQTVQLLKQKSGLEDKDIKLKRKRKKGGPNPLSCKKKQKKSVVNQPSSSGKIRKRKRIKISSHIKEALKNSS